MVLQPTSRRYPYDATPDEIQAVFQERLRTLSDATRRVTWGEPLPVTWRKDWKACVTLRGRDSDGSLLVTITCSGPGLNRPYVRNVRMVKQHRLNLNRG